MIPNDHPMLSPLTLRLNTPEINRLKESLTQWIWTGATGGFIEGAPRAGKTTALKMLSEELITRTGASVPSHIFSVPPRDRGTIQTLYRNLCISADIDIKHKTKINSDVLLDDFYHFLMDKAFQAESDRAVLFVDEMQRLHINQIEVFAELHDLMEKKDVLLSVFFTGNDSECDALIKAIEHKTRRHIQGRFFNQRTIFRGINSHKELRTCLKQYDSLRFPPGTGPTYTAAFLPAETEEGFKLAQLTSDIWDVYKGYKADYNISAWGMKYFTVAINVLLMDYLPKYGVNDFSSDMIKHCIDISGLVPSKIR